jgi:hypothetical protein
MTKKCDRCDQPVPEYTVEDDYGELVCDDCDQKASEAAYERLCEDFHDGGSTRFTTLLEQQIAARKLK